MSLSLLMGLKQSFGDTGLMTTNKTISLVFAVVLAPIKVFDSNVVPVTEDTKLNFHPAPKGNQLFIPPLLHNLNVLAVHAELIRAEKSPAI